MISVPKIDKDKVKKNNYIQKHFQTQKLLTSTSTTLHNTIIPNIFLKGNIRKAWG